MKMRSDCVLNKLTPEQLNEIYDSLASGIAYTEVVKRCSAPAPEGFGIKTHINTLFRFYTAERRRRHAEELAAAKLENLLSDNTDEIIQNVKVELAHACYELAHRPGAPQTINALSRVTHRLDLLRLDQQRLTLEEQRVSLHDRLLAEKIRQFNFNAAREAAKHALEIKDTLARKDIDLEDKVWKISEHVFGPPPSPNSQ